MPENRDGPRRGRPKVSPPSSTSAIVTDLALERHYRRLRQTATVPVPCGPGPCTCYGTGSGGRPA